MKFVPQYRSFICCVIWLSPCFIITTITASTAVSGLAIEINWRESIPKALELTDKTLIKIKDRWEISKYPNFLKSGAMSNFSWDLMKYRYQMKLFQLGVNGKSLSSLSNQFIISFMGSSVTASHDVFFNMSGTEHVKSLFTPIFESLGIELVVNNVAIGNNPCLPYDVCVHTFAGLQPDIVHWEQVSSFSNCYYDLYFTITTNHMGLIYFSIINADKEL